MVAAGKTPHRVTRYLCAPDSPFRKDMEHRASGGLLAVDLRAEIVAYQLCKIDDTWAEAAHRDVSCFHKRALFARPAYVSAKLRARQTLASLDILDGHDETLFWKCMERTSSLGHLDPRKSLMLTPSRKVAGAKLLALVYRNDEAATQRDWGAELNLLPKKASCKQSALERLQKEYLHSVMIDGCVSACRSVTTLSWRA